MVTFPAFERLLEKLPDLVLDTPEAAVLMSNFIARCVADDCLPPKFVQSKTGADLNSSARSIDYSTITGLYLAERAVILWVSTHI